MSMYYIGSMVFSDGKDILHYGRRGMRWGKHKFGKRITRNKLKNRIFINSNPNRASNRSTSATASSAPNVTRATYEEHPFFGLGNVNILEGYNNAQFQGEGTYYISDNGSDYTVHVNSNGSVDSVTPGIPTSSNRPSNRPRTHDKKPAVGAPVHVEKTEKMNLGKMVDMAIDQSSIKFKSVAKAIVHGAKLVNDIAQKANKTVSNINATVNKGKTALSNVLNSVGNYAVSLFKKK